MTGRPIANLTTDWMLGLPNVEFSPDSRFVFAPSPAGGGLTKWNVTTGRELGLYRYSDKFPARGSLMAFRPSASGRTVEAISGPFSSGDPILHARWDSDSGKLLSENPITIESMPRLAAYSSNGRWLATGFQLFPIEVGPSGNTLPRDGASIFDTGTFSADSRLLVKVVHRHIDGKLAWRAVIFEVATGQRLVEFPLKGIARCALHPDGRSVAVADAGGLTYFDLITGKLFAEQRSPVNDPSRPGQSFANVLRFFPDGSKLITGHADTTALVWSVPARPKSAQALDAKERAAAWDDLISTDGAKGWAAVWALADDPGVAAFFRDRIKPVEPLPAEEFNRLLADLGNDDFSTREAATRKLEKAGERAAGQLRAALLTKQSAEQRRRIEALSSAIGRADGKLAGERLRAARAVAALELAGTADAHQLLNKLAAGAVGALTTEEAKRALERLNR